MDEDDMLGILLSQAPEEMEAARFEIQEFTPESQPVKTMSDKSMEKVDKHVRMGIYASTTLLSFPARKTIRATFRIADNGSQQSGR